MDTTTANLADVVKTKIVEIKLEEWVKVLVESVVLTKAKKQSKLHYIIQIIDETKSSTQK